MAVEYVFLGTATALVAGIAALICVKTRDICYPIGIALMYYFSLLGGWVVVAERSSGVLSRPFANACKALYPVCLGGNYCLTLALYTSFLVATELAILYTAPRFRATGNGETAVLWLSLPRVLTIATAGGCACIALMLTATADVVSDTSLYSAHTQFESGIAHLYSILLFVGSVPGVLGAVLCVTGRNGRFLRSSASPVHYAACALVVLAMTVFRAVMGGKGFTFQTLIFGVTLYCVNAARPRYWTLAVISTVVLVLMGTMDQTRGLPVADMLDAVVSSHGEIVGEGLYSLLGSGEKLSSHISMYAVVDRELPCTGGTSVLSLAASCIPRFLWSDRPEGIYDYYHRSLGLEDGQGFTIHHATGWYLNFGAWSVPVGGMVFGLVWAWLARFSQHSRSRRRSSIRAMSLGAVAPFVFVSTIPMLIRNGMEGYKTLIVELAIVAVIVRYAIVCSGRRVAGDGFSLQRRAMAWHLNGSADRRAVSTIGRRRPASVACTTNNARSYSRTVDLGK